MQRTILKAILLTACVAACETAPGTAPAQAPMPPPAAEAPGCADLVYIYATDAAQGLARETAWLAEHRPGAALVSRTEARCEGVPVHRVVLIADGVQEVVLFDTSSYFGRVDGDDLDDLLDG